MGSRSKVISNIIIIVGLGLVLIPLARYAKTSYHQYQALAAFEYHASIEQVDELPADVEGLLEIKAINLKNVVSYGVSEDDLKKGPGFFPQSSHPERGNVSIGSHRGAYGSYFFNLHKLKKGDKVQLTLGGKRYHYSVNESFVVPDTEWSVVESGDEPMLTLVTCLIHDNRRRLIVKAELTEIEELENRE